MAKLLSDCVLNSICDGKDNRPQRNPAKKPTNAWDMEWYTTSKSILIEPLKHFPKLTKSGRVAKNQNTKTQKETRRERKNPGNEVSRIKIKDFGISTMNNNNITDANNSDYNYASECC